MGHLSVPGCPGTPSVLAAPQLLQQGQSPPAAPPWDGCGPIYRPGYEHMDTIMCTVYNCLQITDRSNDRYTNLKAPILKKTISFSVMCVGKIQKNECEKVDTHM